MKVVSVQLVFWSCPIGYQIFVIFRWRRKLLQWEKCDSPSSHKSFRISFRFVFFSNFFLLHFYPFDSLYKNVKKWKQLNVWKIRHFSKKKKRKGNLSFKVKPFIFQITFYYLSKHISHHKIVSYLKLFPPRKNITVSNSSKNFSQNMTFLIGWKSPKNYGGTLPSSSKRSSSSSHHHSASRSSAATSRSGPTSAGKLFKN